MDANSELQFVLGQLGSTQIARLRRHASLGDPDAIRALRELITLPPEPRGFSRHSSDGRTSAP
jgi:hypothetical protein